MTEELLLVTEKDYLRLKSLIEVKDPEEIENLEIELDRAQLLADDEVPPDLVTMNSIFRFENISENKQMIMSIVYPQESNAQENKVSILAPLGSALLGLRVGQEINWQFPDGKTKKLKVLEILYQPEANGDWHL